MAKNTPTTNTPTNNVHVGHDVKGESVRKIDDAQPAPRNIPREKFREIADRVLTEHKRPLEWLRDK